MRSDAKFIARNAGFGRRPIVATAVCFALSWFGGAMAPTPAGADPQFRADGPNSEAYGRGEGYPHCRTYFREQRCLVGSHTRFDQLFPARTIAAPKTPSRLERGRSEPVLTYSLVGQSHTVEDFMNRNPVMGLLIAKGDTILLERYQYGRTDKDRFASFSMAKTLTALLIGIAIKEGAIRSIDDLAETYVPSLRGTEYGRTSIKALLQMSSGVTFREAYDGGDDIALLGRLTLGQDQGGSIGAVKRFNKRHAPPGERYQYSSAETLVLGIVLAHATRQNVSDYTRKKLWEPLGAEAEAKWTIDATGQEITFAYFNAVLRDWARLALMLANDGSWQGKGIVPAEWLHTATTVAPSDHRLKPGAASVFYGYGYQTWILAGDRRMFALRGVRGQIILVDPQSKLVLVHMAVCPREVDQFADREVLALWDALLRQLQ